MDNDIYAQWLNDLDQNGYELFMRSTALTQAEKDLLPVADKQPYIDRFNAEKPVNELIETLNDYRE